MSITLETGTVLPKSGAGRRAKPLDETFLKALTKALKDNPSQDDEDGKKRSMLYGPNERYDTKGKAAGTGQRYAEKVREALNVPKVSVRVFPDGNKFGWQAYIPMGVLNAEPEQASPAQ